MPATVNNITINNTAGVTLTNATTATGLTGLNGALNLDNGILVTTAVNLLYVTNTSPTAVTGYDVTSYVNGPLKWALATGNSYFFPVGDASYYRPFELLNLSTTGAPVLTVTMGSAGATTGDGVTGRNWYAQESGTWTGATATVRLTEANLISTDNVESPLLNQAAMWPMEPTTLGLPYLLPQP